jgi:hypothetical protein
MSLGDQEQEIVVRAARGPRVRRAARPRPPVRRRPLGELAAELDGVRRLRDACVAVGALRQAAERTDELERLTREYVARRDAPPVVPPV